MMPDKRRLWLLIALLLALNLIFMVVDAVVLPGRGISDVARISPPSTLQREIRPTPRQQPNQLQLMLRQFGIHPIGFESPRPGVQSFPGETRARFPMTQQPALRPFSLHESGWGGIATHLVGLLALLSITVVLAYFMPLRLKVMRDILGGPWSHKLRVLAIGVFCYLAAILLALLLASLVTGLVYTMLAVVALALLTVVGISAVALAVGRWLAWRAGADSSPLAQLSIGVLLVFPLTILPYAGWVVAGIIASFGLGAILLTRMGSGRPWSLEVLQ